MAARFWQRLRGIVLPALFCCVLAPAAHAGFQITPMLIEVPPGSSIATYTLRNTSDRPLNVQISAVLWTQTGDQDHYLPAEHLLVVPQILSVPPGREQLVRVALRGPRPAGELAYRLHFNEIPPAPKKGFIGVQTVLNMDLPLFFLPPNVTNRYSVTLSHGPRRATAVLTVHNSGTRFLRISHMTLLGTGGDELGEQGGPLYVLPGVTRHWTISLKKGSSGLAAGEYRLRIASDGNQQIRTLTLH